MQCGRPWNGLFLAAIVPCVVESMYVHTYIRKLNLEPVTMKT